MRFAGVGVCNTAIDWALFLVLHDRLGITLANFFSSSAGMVFSFVVNGLFTFRAERLTLRQAAALRRHHRHCDVGRTAAADPRLALGARARGRRR